MKERKMLVRIVWEKNKSALSATIHPYCASNKHRPARRVGGCSTGLTSALPIDIFIWCESLHRSPNIQEYAKPTWFKARKIKKEGTIWSCDQSYHLSLLFLFFIFFYEGPKLTHPCMIHQLSNSGRWAVHHEPVVLLCLYKLSKNSIQTIPFLLCDLSLIFVSS